MSDINQLLTLHTHLIGGSAPCLDASPEEIISRHCENILGTRDIHLGFCVEQAYVFFLCLPSRVLEPGTEPLTPLLQALPAHPLHRGDGIYRISHFGRSHIVLKSGTQLRYLSNFDEVIDDYITSLKLSVYSLNNEPGNALVRIPDLYRTAAEKLHKPLQWLAVAGIFLSTLATGAAKLYEATRIEIPDYVTPAIKRTEALVRDVQTTQPLLQQVQRFDALSATVVRAGGWIDVYHSTGRDQEHFRILLPEWVSRDYIEALGPKVVTDLAGNGLIQAIKGSPLEKGKP